MKRLAVALAAVGAIAAMTAGYEAAAKPKRPPMRYASPAAIVAADVAMSQLAQRKGQWAAMRDMATEDALLFAPQPVIARDWLKSQAPTAKATSWQPQQVWLSCDGSLAVSYGSTQLAAGGPGYFTTVWQRQKKGDYKWVMTQSDGLAAALVAPDMIGAGVATCDRPARPQPTPGVPTPTPPPAFPAGTRGGWSEDRTLSWAVAVDANCGRGLTVSLYRGAGKPMEPVLTKQVAGTPQHGVCRIMTDPQLGALFVSAFVTLFVVIDPPGCAPIFAGLTNGATAVQARSMAVRACFIATCILFAFALFGEQLLRALHIELNSFRIAGGIMLFLIALEMVFEKRTQRRTERAEKVRAHNDAHTDEAPEFNDVSVFPMAMPMLAGPGSIATVMLLMSRSQGTEATLVILAALIAVLLLSLVALLAAGPLMRLLGDQVEAVITRLLGVLLAALAAQYVIDGIREAI